MMLPSFFACWDEIGHHHQHPSAAVYRLTLNTHICILTTPVIFVLFQPLITYAPIPEVLCGAGGFEITRNVFGQLKSSMQWCNLSQTSQLLSEATLLENKTRASISWRFSGCSRFPARLLFYLLELLEAQIALEQQRGSFC
jgi:hypothetical protein